MEVTYINPPELGKPAGYSHGILVPGGRLLFVAGQTGQKAGTGFKEQFDLALKGVLKIVETAGGAPPNIVSMTIFVTDKAEYAGARKQIGGDYRERMGEHYPAMTLVEVKGLYEEGAKVEIQATAVI